MNSDYLATGVYRAASQLRRDIGADLSVIGHDDLPTSAFLDPPLTTVAFDREQLGRVVMARLLGDGGPDDDRLPVTLQIRQSVADLTSS